MKKKVDTLNADIVGRIGQGVQLLCTYPIEDVAAGMKVAKIHGDVTMAQKIIQGQDEDLLKQFCVINSKGQVEYDGEEPVFIKDKKGEYDALRKKLLEKPFKLNGIGKLKESDFAGTVKLSPLVFVWLGGIFVSDPQKHVVASVKVTKGDLTSYIWPGINQACNVLTNSPDLCFRIVTFYYRIKEAFDKVQIERRATLDPYVEKDNDGNEKVDNKNQVIFKGPSEQREAYDIVEKGLFQEKVGICACPLSEKELKTLKRDSFSPLLMSNLNYLTKK